MASNFSILVDTLVDTSKIEPMLKKRKYKINVDLDSSNAKNLF